MWIVGGVERLDVHGGALPATCACRWSLHVWLGVVVAVVRNGFMHEKRGLEYQVWGVSDW